MMEMILPVVKVRREGRKGYHLIDARAYDPMIHQLADEPATEPQQVARRRGRPPKSTVTEATNGDR